MSVRVKIRIRIRASFRLLRNCCKLALYMSGFGKNVQGRVRVRVSVR